MARTSQSTAWRPYAPVAAGRRPERESTRYWTALAQARTTANHKARCEKVSLDGQATGNSNRATVRNSTSVLALATRRAGTLTPRRATTTRYEVITTSRKARRATGTQVTWPSAAIAASAPSTRNLSANGSRNAPEALGPWRLASQPSTKSLPAKAAQSSRAAQEGVARSTSRTSRGVAASRAAVTPLAAVFSLHGAAVVVASVMPLYPRRKVTGQSRPGGGSRLELDHRRPVPVRFPSVLTLASQRRADQVRAR